MLVGIVFEHHTVVKLRLVVRLMLLSVKKNCEGKNPIIQETETETHTLFKEKSNFNINVTYYCAIQ